MLRRDFLKGVAACAALAAAPCSARQRASISDPWMIWATRSGETIQADIRTPKGIAAINHILRDVSANVTGSVDMDLARLLAWIQGYLAAYDRHHVIRVHSGLRMPETNLKTPGSSRNSQHLPFGQARFFRAADISMRGIPHDYLGQLAAIPRFGGVGIYPSKNFLHLDTGNIRTWKTN